MTISIIINATMDQVIYQLCQWSNRDFIESYLPFAQVGKVGSSSRNHLLGYTRYKLNALSDLEAALSAGDIFQEKDTNPRILIDYQELELNQESLAIIQGFQGDSLILYSLSPDTGLIKLIGKNLAIQVIDYKQLPKDKNTKDIYKTSLNNIAQDYNNFLNLGLNPRELNQITTSSSTYREIIDNLDFLSLTESPSSHIGEFIIEEKPMLFMLPFGPTMSKSVIQTWKNIPEADMQLSLSLAFTKLQKLGQKNLIQEVINIDYKVKTSTKLAPLVLWKYLLWRVVN